MRYGQREDASGCRLRFERQVTGSPPLGFEGGRHEVGIVRSVLGGCLEQVVIFDEMDLCQVRVGMSPAVGAWQTIANYERVFCGSGLCMNCPETLI